MNSTSRKPPENLPLIEIPEPPDSLDLKVSGLEVRLMLRATRQQFFVIAFVSADKDRNGRRVVRYWLDGNGFRCRIWSGARRFVSLGEAQEFLPSIIAAYRKKAARKQ